MSKNSEQDLVEVTAQKALDESRQSGSSATVRADSLEQAEDIAQAFSLLTDDDTCDYADLGMVEDDEGMLDCWGEDYRVSVYYPL